MMAKQTELSSANESKYSFVQCVVECIYLYLYGKLSQGIFIKDLSNWSFFGQWAFW